MGLIVKLFVALGQVACGVLHSWRGTKEEARRTSNPKGWARSFTYTQHQRTICYSQQSVYAADSGIQEAKPSVGRSADVRSARPWRTHHFVLLPRFRARWAQQLVLGSWS